MSDFAQNSAWPVPGTGQFMQSNSTNSNIIPQGNSMPLEYLTPAQNSAPANIGFQNFFGGPVDGFSTQRNYESTESISEYAYTDTNDTTVSAETTQCIQHPLSGPQEHNDDVLGIQTVQERPNSFGIQSSPEPSSFSTRSTRSITQNRRYTGNLEDLLNRVQYACDRVRYGELCCDKDAKAISCLARVPIEDVERLLQCKVNFGRPTFARVNKDEHSSESSSIISSNKRASISQDRQFKITKSHSRLNNGLKNRKKNENNLKTYRFTPESLPTSLVTKAQSSCHQTRESCLEGKTESELEANRHMSWNPVKPFSCTLLCGATFRTPYDFKRHMKRDCKQVGWICDLSKRVRCAQGMRCTFCGDLNPDEKHFEDTHKKISCHEKNLERPVHIFNREDNLRSHFRNIHPGFDVECYLPVAKFEVENDVRRVCGFCGTLFSTWEEWADHVVDQFKKQSTMDRWYEPWIGSPRPENCTTPQIDEDPMEEDDGSVTDQNDTDRNNENEDNSKSSPSNQHDWNMDLFPSQGEDTSSYYDYLFQFCFKGTTLEDDFCKGTLKIGHIEVIVKRIDKELTRTNSFHRNFTATGTMVLFLCDQMKRDFSFSVVSGDMIEEKVIKIGPFSKICTILIRDSKESSQYALKSIKHRPVDRLLEEARLINALKHPNIIQLRGFLSNSKETALLLSPIAQSTLEDILESRSNRAVINSANFGCIASALHHIHEQGIIHMDLKPSNILIKGQRWILTDFSASWTSNRKGPVEFTERYAAPEVFESKPLTAAADIFSFGATVVHSIASLCNRPDIMRIWSYSQAAYRLREFLVDVVYDKFRFGRDSNFNVWNIDLLDMMLSKIPEHRPSISKILRSYSPNVCYQTTSNQENQNFLLSNVDGTKDKPGWALSNNTNKLKDIRVLKDIKYSYHEDLEGRQVNGDIYEHIVSKNLTKQTPLKHGVVTLEEANSNQNIALEGSITPDKLTIESDMKSSPTDSVAKYANLPFKKSSQPTRKLWIPVDHFESIQARHRKSAESLQCIYGPLAAADHIRLIELQPSSDPDSTPRMTLINTSLNDDTTHYMALSYVWGDTNNPEAVEINGTEKLVGRNLYTALQFLQTIDHQDQQSLYLWADAICINQNDSAERNHQVSLISAVYRQAQTVLVWLGQQSNWSCKTDLLLAHPWFTRVWTLQEVAAATNVALSCGHKIIPWALFIKDIEQQKLNLKNSDVSFAAHASLDSVIDGLERLDLVEELSSQDIVTMDLIDLFDRTRSCRATDSRDRIYGLLGLFSDYQEMGIMVDYNKSVEEVYVDFTQRLFRYKGMSSLHQIRTLCGSYRPSSCPSWCWTGQSVNFSTGSFRAGFPVNEQFNGSIVLSGKLNRIEIGTGMFKLIGISFDEIDSDFISLQQDMKHVHKSVGDYLCAFGASYKSSLDQNRRLAKLIQMTIKGGHQIDENLKISRDRSTKSEIGDKPSSLLVCSAVSLKKLNERAGNGLFVTKAGRLGLGPEDIQIGDLIVAFLGSKVPHIMRKKDKSSYRLISDCFVDGFMDGEVFKEGYRSQLETFTIF